jgi:hypothetical protein
MNLLRTGAVAVYRVVLMRERGTEGVYHARKPLEQPKIVNIKSLQPLARAFHVARQPPDIDPQMTPVRDDHLAAYHHTVNRRAILGMHKLVDGVVER